MGNNLWRSTDAQVPLLPDWGEQVDGEDLEMLETYATVKRETGEEERTTVVGWEREGVLG